jgi:hypothetical protein
MSAVWQKNQPTASLRRVALYVQAADGTSIAGRGQDFTGYVYITQDGNDYVLAAGTITNRRRALVVADDTVEAVDLTDNELDLTAHGLETGDGPIRFTTSGTLPTGLATATDYYVIAVNANSISLATSLANAYAGTEIDLTGAGSGTHTLVDTASTQRGIDGWFNYTATQAETNYDAAEIYVAVLGHATYTAQSTVAIATEGYGDYVIEGSTTRDDALRLVMRSLVAKFSVSGNDYVFRDLADSKDSHHGTVTASGRITAVVDDPT